jgi:integrase
MGRHGYLFQRPGSQNWHVKLQSPTRRVERSLRTPDRREAEVRALPLIAEHKAALLVARPRLELMWRHEYEPGREHIGPDGRRVIATDRELLFLDDHGVITDRASNGASEYAALGLEKRLGLPGPIFGMFQVNESEVAKSPAVAAKSADDAIIETYLKHAKRGPVIGFYEREARDIWALYKQLTGGKALKDATRDDGRKIVEYLEAKGNKSRTIKKKLMWLNAAVNLAIKDGKLQSNPFAGIAPERKDVTERLPLNDADVKEVKRNLTQLDKSDQTLFRLLATTGMRLSEAFEIDGEMRERGVRYVIIGVKTDQSRRRVPLPADALPFLPKTIHGPLFSGGESAASKRLNRFLDDIGITDRRKVIHSLRHRAQDRLRAAECPQDIRWALLGHEEKTVAEDYGKGFSVPQLKRWIDKIGF